MKDVNERIVRISEHVAQAHGLTAEVTFDPNKPIPFNHNPHYYVKDEVL